MLSMPFRQPATLLAPRQGVVRATRGSARHANAQLTRRKLRAEAAVAKAGIKMLFLIVLFILPALFVITLVPGLLSVLRDLNGGIGARWNRKG